MGGCLVGYMQKSVLFLELLLYNKFYWCIIVSALRFLGLIGLKGSKLYQFVKLFIFDVTNDFPFQLLFCIFEIETGSIHPFQNQQKFLSLHFI